MSCLTLSFTWKERAIIKIRCTNVSPRVHWINSHTISGRSSWSEYVNTVALIYCGIIL